MLFGDRYVEDLRDLQRSVNAMLSVAQTFTANPKTNSKYDPQTVHCCVTDRCVRVAQFDFLRVADLGRSVTNADPCRTLEHHARKSSRKYKRGGIFIYIVQNKK